MPIISHSLTTTTQADGSTANVLRMYDQDAREYMQTFFAPAGFDVAGKVNLMKVELEVQLAEQEFQTIVGL